MTKQITILKPADVRQPDHWECGDCASKSAASLWGIGPDTLAGWVTLLGSSEEKSTSAQAIIKAFTDLGCDVVAQQNMSIDDLAESIAAGRPVICPVQDYTGVRSAKALWDYGHWVLVIGVIPDYVIIQDSSIENALGMPGGDVPKAEETDMGNLAAPGRVLVYRDQSVVPADQPDALTWLEKWHDVGEDGTEYTQYGISIGKPPEPAAPEANAAHQKEHATMANDNKPASENTQWLKVSTSGRPIGVDREKEVIRGFIVAQEGPFKSEGRGEFDKQALQTILELIKASPNGLKSRLAHPDESNDGIGKLLGRLKDPWLDMLTVRESEGAQKTDPVACVRGDLWINPAAHKASFDMADWLMTAAESDPDAISSSLVLSTEREYRIDAKGVPLTDAEGNELPPLWRPTALHAADVVDTGDAVDGLLSAQLTPERLEEIPNGVVFAGAKMLDKQFAGKPRAFVADRCQAFLRRYLDRRYGEDLAAGDGSDGSGGGEQNSLQAALQRVLGMLRAQNWLYHSAHWQTSGATFYGQHLLFERLYTGLVDEYDALAEKMVAAFGPAAVEPVQAIQAASSRVAEWAGENAVAAGLQAEAALAEALKAALGLSTDNPGFQNFLQGICDAHQTNLYLLQQVQGGKTAKEAMAAVGNGGIRKLLRQQIRDIRAMLGDPGSSIGGQDEPGAPDQPENGDDNPYPGGPSNALHDGCRSTLAYHHLTLCRLCGEKMQACGCDHVEHESRVVTMAKEPCAACKAKLEAPGDGGPPDSPGKSGDVMPEGPDAAGMDLRRRELTLLDLAI
jgi:DNA-binding ferritin-like protein